MNKFTLILIFSPFLSLSQTSYLETTTYEYDDLNRLIQVDFSNGTIYNYVYDNLGNRVQVAVTEPKDIYLENVFVSQPTAIPGDNINVSADFKYLGSQTTQQLPFFVLGYHISNTCNYGVQSILLDTDAANLGINNNSDFLSKILTIPANTIPGNYEILFYADLYDDLSEQYY